MRGQRVHDETRSKENHFGGEYSSCIMGTVGIRRRVVQIFGGTDVAIRSGNGYVYKLISTAMVQNREG